MKLEKAVLYLIMRSIIPLQSYRDLIKVDASLPAKPKRVIHFYEESKSQVLIDRVDANENNYDSKEKETWIHHLGFPAEKNRVPFLAPIFQVENLLLKKSGNPIKTSEGAYQEVSCWRGMLEVFTRSRTEKEANHLVTKQFLEAIYRNYDGDIAATVKSQLFSSFDFGKGWFSRGISLGTHHVSNAITLADRLQRKKRKRVLLAERIENAKQLHARNMQTKRGVPPPRRYNVSI